MFSLLCWVTGFRPPVATSQRGRWGDRSLGALPSFRETPAALVSVVGAGRRGGWTLLRAGLRGLRSQSGVAGRAARPGPPRWAWERGSSGWLSSGARPPEGPAGRSGLGSCRVSECWSLAPLSPAQSPAAPAVLWSSARRCLVSSVRFPSALPAKSLVPCLPHGGCSEPGLFSLQMARLPHSRFLLLLKPQKQSKCPRSALRSPSLLPVPHLSLLHSG